MKISKLIKNTILGIGLGTLISTIIGITTSLVFPDGFISSHDYLVYSIASMIIGVGFYLPSIIYEYDNMSLPVQMIIHMSIGISIYLIAAFYAGWIPTNNGPIVLFGSIILVIILTFIIWSGFYLYYKREAKLLNKRLNNL